MKVRIIGHNYRSVAFNQPFTELFFKINYKTKKDKIIHFFREDNVIQRQVYKLICKMLKQILEKSTIDEAWKLSKESFQEGNAFKKLKVLEKEIIPKLSNCIIYYVDNYNLDKNLREYYSFYRILSPKGEYLFSLPARLNLPTSEGEEVTDIITREPEDSSQSSNGGDYYAGYRVWKITHKKIELYKVQYNYMLYSDFQEQGWEEPEICTSLREVAEMTGEDIDLSNL